MRETLAAQAAAAQAEAAQAEAARAEAGTAEVPPVAQWAAARAFTARCRAYAEAELARRAAAGKDLTEWAVYLRFCDHTLRELDDGTLDGWFDPAVVSPGHTGG